MEEAFAEPSWSETLPLTSSDIRSRIRDQCGVYRIRAFTPSGEPLQIARCNGVDAQGILHIGESQRLQTRVLFFLQAATNGKAAHSAGCEFYESGFGKHFSLNCLRWDFASCGSKAEAVELELRLQRGYRRIFLDKPPLDGSIGKQAKG
jgi:hypothetical protein